MAVPTRFYPRADKIACSYTYIYYVCVCIDFQVINFKTRNESTINIPYTLYIIIILLVLFSPAFALDYLKRMSVSLENSIQLNRFRIAIAKRDRFFWKSLNAYTTVRVVRQRFWNTMPLLPAFIHLSGYGPSNPVPLCTAPERLCDARLTKLKTAIII